MRHLALLLSLLVFSSCDAALDPAASGGADLEAETSDGSSLAKEGSEAAVRIATRPILDPDESFDWNFRFEGLDPANDVPITFRTVASGGKQNVITSYITMTPLVAGGYSFESVWKIHQTQAALLYPVVLDARNRDGDGDGLFVEGPFEVSVDDEPPTTEEPGKSYHKKKRGYVIDYVDTDDGFAPTPASLSIPSAGVMLDDVAYLVYVPLGNRLPGAEDTRVDVYGPRETRLITESVGQGELPQAVLDVIPSE